MTMTDEAVVEGEETAVETPATEEGNEENDMDAGSENDDAAM